MNLAIVRDDLTDAQVHALLEEHLRDMHSQSPPESVHALDLTGLRRPEVTFWSAWDGSTLAGCGALKRLDDAHGEIKSMRTARAYRRAGVGKAMLEHILAAARAGGYARVSLETGTQEGFIPARTLYARYGFVECGPFAEYRLDPNSVFMTLALR